MGWGTGHTPFVFTLRGGPSRAGGAAAGDHRVSLFALLTFSFKIFFLAVNVAMVID